MPAVVDRKMLTTQHATGLSSLVKNAKNVMHVVKRRDEFGNLKQCDKDSFLTEAEYDRLIVVYKDAGSTGSMDGPAQQVLLSATLKMLRERPPPQDYTKSEQRVLEPGGKLNLSWCQTLAEVYKLLQMEVRGLCVHACAERTVLGPQLTSLFLVGGRRPSSPPLPPPPLP